MMADDPRADARRVADALADLFDAAPPEGRSGCEEELRAAGVDPDLVGHRLARLAEHALSGRGSRRHGARPPRREMEPGRRIPSRSRPVMPASRSVRLAGAFACAVLITWLASRALLLHFSNAGGESASPQRYAVTNLVSPLFSPAKTDTHEWTSLVTDTWTLDSTTAKRAQELLPAPVLDRVERGDSTFKVVVLDPAGFRGHYSPRFWAASASNSDRYRLAPETCGLLDRTTGAAPTSYFGYPFPQVDRTDPQAACEIMWNVEAAAAMAGGRESTEDADAFDPARFYTLTLQVHSLAYLGRDSGQIPNPQNLRTERVISALAPTDMQGGMWLTRRPMQADAPDQTWRFIPALRRVKALSPAQRGEPLPKVGITVDDYDCFDGRLEAFDWRLIGAHDVLAPIISLAPLPQREVAGGRVQVDLPAITAAFERPERPGVAWQVTDGLQLTPRPAWVVEGTPRDPQYPIGKTVLYVDQDLYRPYWKLSYDRAGRLANHALCGQSWSRSADGEFTAPGTSLVALADETGNATLVRPRSEILDQGLRGWSAPIIQTVR